MHLSAHAICIYIIPIFLCFVVVVVVVRFDGAGFSFAGTKDVLSSVAGDVMVDGGYCVNAAEVFWTPSDRKEVLTKRDIILDFPELVDF
mmetsp:Transcript_8262/g.12777  ORF Transcript_8262/g.12777 Transcript_8262/m.12777 type:complete len:89 (-) Transcript_8262:17-283(-)